MLESSSRRSRASASRLPAAAFVICRPMVVLYVVRPPLQQRRPTATYVRAFEAYGSPFMLVLVFYRVLNQTVFLLNKPKQYLIISEPCVKLSFVLSTPITKLHANRLQVLDTFFSFFLCT